MKNSNFKLAMAPIINDSSPYIQQGDCLLKKIGTKGVFLKEYKEIPKEAKPKNTHIVLVGQDNNHAIYSNSSENFEVLEHDGVTFLKIKDTCYLDHVKKAGEGHAEHTAHLVPPGEWFVDQVLEFDHLLEESRKVID